MSRISRIIFTSVIVCAASVQDAMGFNPVRSTPSSSSESRTQSSLGVNNALNLYDDIDYVRSLEDQLIQFSKIDDDDIRRNDFEAFVTGRLQEELEDAKSTVQRLKLKSLDFVKAMDQSILKLGQSAQNQGWERHVTSGFEPVPKGGNDIWPYVDMLIQFKLLISNMEQMSNKRTRAQPVGNGCKCPECPGLVSCKDGKKKKSPQQAHNDIVN